MIKITPGIIINPDELDEQFIHASGPGGQNVNKVATAVRLRFNVRTSQSLPAAVRDRLLSSEKKRFNRSGEIVIVARRFRSQARNRADAQARLAAWISTALHPPRLRHKTLPSRATKQRRRAEKRRRSELKHARRETNDFD